MKILASLILVTFAVPAFASQVSSNKQSTDKICGVASVDINNTRGEDSLPLIVRGNADCTERFIDLVSNEYLGADGEVGNSDQDILESLIIFQSQSQKVCDIVNVTEQGESKIQIKNDSTTSGFYFGTGERVHLKFEARCFLN